LDLNGDLLERDAVELTRAIAAHELSAEDLMAATLARIEAVNPRFGAIVALRDAEALLAEARAQDAAIARGAPAGPLQGLPIAIKDLVDVAGLPTTKGSRLLKDFVPAADSLMVRRLKAAGALIIGKTNVPEFALGSYSFNPVYGATRNAYDERLTAGGSSSGASVALALRMLPIADGSDYGGSLRNPAGWNNVFGFRPSYGLVPGDDLDVWTAKLGVLGPMARSVEDLATLLSVQAGYDPAVPLSHDGDPARFRAPLASDIKGKRIAWFGDYGGAMPCDPGVLELGRAAMATFESLGGVVEEARPDFDFDELWRAFVTLRHWHNAPLLDAYRDPAKRALLPETAIYEVENGLKLTAYDVADASLARSRWSAALARLFERYDAFALPTAQVFAYPVDQRFPQTVAGRPLTTYHEWMKSAAPATMAGAPALALPAGFDAEGRAMGVQLVGRPRGDLEVLKLGYAYDQATRWPRRRRPTALG
jgi:amidase